MKKPKRVHICKLLDRSERGHWASECPFTWVDWRTIAMSSMAFGAVREHWSVDEIDGTVFTWCVDP